jgi:sugar (pentulose or hexulose) kinase
VKRWSSLSAYFLSKLTGQLQPMTFSEASYTGLMDREDLQWHPGLLNLLGISPITLPALCDIDDLYKGSMSPEYRKRWPELNGTAWARGIAEPAAFSVGAGCNGGGRPRVCVHMGNTEASIRVCMSSKQAHRQYSSSKSGSGHTQHAGQVPENGDKRTDERSAQSSSGLCLFTVKRDTVLVGGSLADGGCIYAWGTQQLAGTCLL